MKLEGKEHYQRIYDANLVDEAQWLQYAARGKADSVEQVLARRGVSPESLLELGAGTGAVIAECARRGLAKEYWAVDYSESATEYLRDTVPGVHVVAADITSPEFSLGRHFDVVVLSHVIEHLEEPREMLDALREMDFDHCVLEVPLDDLPVSRLKNLIRDRSENPAGHLQFFTANTFERMVRGSGFEILDRRRYTPVVPIEALRLQARRNGWGTPRFLWTVAVAYALPMMLTPIWSRLYYGFYAVLCRKPAMAR